MLLISITDKQLLKSYDRLDDRFGNQLRTSASNSSNDHCGSDPAIRRDTLTQLVEARLEHVKMSFGFALALLEDLGSVNAKSEVVFVVPVL